MPDTIISDASCFIILSRIDELNLLQRTPLDLQSRLDAGEASALALAIETPNSTIILDDQKARKVAEALGIKVTGTIGVVVQAKPRHVIPSIRPILARIRKANFRLAPEIEVEALSQAGE